MKTCCECEKDFDDECSHENDNFIGTGVLKITDNIGNDICDLSVSGTICPHCGDIEFDDVDIDDTRKPK